MGSYGHPGTRATCDGGVPRARSRSSGSIDAIHPSRRVPRCSKPRRAVPSITKPARSATRRLGTLPTYADHRTRGNAEIVECPVGETLDGRHRDAPAASLGGNPEPDHRALLGGAILQIEGTDQRPRCVSPGRRTWGCQRSSSSATGTDELRGRPRARRAGHRRPTLNLLVLAGGEDRVCVARAGTA